jgi:hypothetical protein
MTARASCKLLAWDALQSQKLQPPHLLRRNHYLSQSQAQQQVGGHQSTRQRWF